MTSPLEQVNACKYLFLDQLSEPATNTLQVILSEALSERPITSGEIAEVDPVLKTILAGSRAIERTANTKVFRVSWPSYIAYAVVDESYSNGEPKTRTGKGRLLVEYEDSDFLDYLSKATFATATYPGPYRHWAILCQDHTLNVASRVPPEIEIIHGG